MGILHRLFGTPDASIARDTFAHLAMKAVRMTGIQQGIEYDALSYSLVIGGVAGAGHEIYLGTFFGDHQRADPADRSDVLARVAQAAANLVPQRAPMLGDDVLLHSVDWRGAQPAPRNRSGLRRV